MNKNLDTERMKRELEGSAFFPKKEENINPPEENRTINPKGSTEEPNRHIEPKGRSAETKSLAKVPADNEVNNELIETFEKGAVAS